MPRKRATHAQTTRAKPKLDASDDDDILKGMKAAEKAAKMKRILQDVRLNGNSLTIFKI